MLPRSHLLSLSARVGRLAWPVIVTNLLQSVVNVADLLMVGRLGPIAIAAVGMSNTVRMLVLVVLLAVTTGAMTLAAQARGAGDRDELSKVARQTLLLAWLGALALSVLGVLAAGPLLGFLNAGGDARATVAGAAYLRVVFGGTVFLVTTLAVNALMQGAGDTRTPLLLTTVVNVLNVAFNAVLIFGLGPLPALGVAGAAWGTVAARGIGALAGLALLASNRNVVALGRGAWRPDVARFRAILRIGVPSGLQGLVRNTAQMLVVRIVTATSAGSYGAAALAIGLQIESFAFMPGLAVSVAATSLVGRSLGAWRPEEARRQGQAALVFGAALMTAAGAVLFVFAPALVRVFDPSAHPVVMEAGTSYLRINALSQPLLAVSMVLGGALRGAGDTRPALVGTLLGRWATVVPLAWLLAGPAGLGVEGVWWSLFVGTGVTAAWLAWRWRGDAWLRIAARTGPLWERHLRALGPERARAFLDGAKGPLMAREGARERVDAAGVSYEGEGGEVRFRLGASPALVRGEDAAYRAGVDLARAGVTPPDPAPPAWEPPAAPPPLEARPRPARAGGDAPSGTTGRGGRGW